jgi:hypothetical protein
MRQNPNNFDPIKPLVKKLWSAKNDRPFKTRTYSAMNIQAVTVLHFMLSDAPHSYTHHMDESWIGQKQWRRPDNIKENFDKQIMGTPIKCDYLILRKAELEAEIEQLENQIDANEPSFTLSERYNTLNKWLKLVEDLIKEKCKK